MYNELPCLCLRAAAQGKTVDDGSAGGIEYRLKDTRKSRIRGSYTRSAGVPVKDPVVTVIWSEVCVTSTGEVGSVGVSTDRWNVSVKFSLAAKA